MTQKTSAAIHSVRVGSPDAPRRVAFVHGLFGRGKNFTKLASGLEPEFQSLLVDLPNHGQSAWTDRVDYAEMADAVASHLEADFASGGPIDLVGHSMGGKVAMVLALRHPHLINKLVIIDISPTAANGGRSEFEHLLGSLATIDLSVLERRADAGAQVRDRIPNDTVRGFLLQNLRSVDTGFEWEPNLSLLRAELETIMGFPEITQPPFTGPVLWIGGERSNYVKDADEPAMRALFPKTLRITMKGAGHWVHSEKPAETLATLRAFLLQQR